MSYYFGRDIWDEMDRVNSQLASLMASQGDDEDDMDSEEETPETCKAPIAPAKDAAVAPAKDAAAKPAKKPETKMESHFYFFPSADVLEKEKEFIIALDLPGVKKEDITIDLHQNKLAVAGTRKPRYMKEDEKAQVLSCKCSYGEFQRVFTLPLGLEPEDISAKFEDGVLYISVAKPKQSEPRRITIM